MATKNLLKLDTFEDFLSLVLLVLLGLFFVSGLWYVVLKGLK